MIYFGINYDKFLNVFSGVGKCFKISTENDDTKN